MIHPRREIDLERVFHDRPSSNQALGSLTLGNEVLPGDECPERLKNLVERAKQFADPFPTGKPAITGKDGLVPANFITPRRPILQTEEGILELDFFIYAPPDNHDMSINASWYLPGQDRPKLVQQAYLSVRNFNNRIAAYRKDSPKILMELEAALGVYEQATEATPSA